MQDQKKLQELLDECKHFDKDNRYLYSLFTPNS